MSEPRPQPFVWTTWITGLLSGDKHCRWAAWFKAHYYYEKVDEDEQRAAALRKWKGEHADMVRDRVAALVADGWRVSVEAQNKFFVRGQSATLAGGPDILAVRDGAPVVGRAVAFDPSLASARAAKEAVVEDCKTGMRRDSDHWQVMIYMLFLPSHHPALKADPRPLAGAVVYRDGIHGIPPSAADADATQRVGAAIREAGGPVAPPRTPSADECRYCDIAACPDRVTSDEPVLDTELW